MSHTTLKHYLNEYLVHLDTLGRSPRTVESYRERILHFITWAELRGVHHPAQASLTVLEGYQRYLGHYRKANGERLSSNSQRERLSSLRLWFRWLLQRHAILYSPADALRLPKEVRRLPMGVLSDHETEQLMRAIDISSPLGLRNRTLLETFWSSGIRRMELANLKLKDVDLSRGALHVHQGKGGKDRMVPLGERAVSWIRRYLQQARPQLSQQRDSGHLFLTHRGNPLKRGSLTAIVGHSLRQTAQLDKAGACHLLRHSMATQMLDNGADTRHIQAILGHEKLDTTQLYTRVAIKQLQKVHAQTHPASRQAEANSEPVEQLDSDPVQPAQRSDKTEPADKH